MLSLLKHFIHGRSHQQRFQLLGDLLRNQALSKEALLAKQKLDLGNIVCYAERNTPYYREKYAQSPRDDSNEFLISTLPILHKDDVVQHRESMVAREIKRHTLKVGNTGGSTGKPVSFYYDQDKHELMRAGMCRSYMWSGWKPGQKILNFWGARQDLHQGKEFSQPFRDYFAAEQTIAAVEYTGAQLATWVQTIRAYKPVLLQGYASILAELARFLISHNIHLPKTLLGIYSTAEVLGDEQRKLIEAAFGCKVFNQYGSREIPNIACECRYGNLHIFTDMVYLESQKIHDEDRLLITSLTNRVMPFIRYELGDSGRLKEGGCACGSPFPLMEMGMCRSNDLIKTRNGKSIHPSYFNRLLYGKTEISQYQYIQNELDKITLNIVSAQKLDTETLRSIRENLRKDLDTNMILEVNYVSEIKRSASGKHRFVISQIPLQSKSPDFS
jgi:phenylacetate-CoA ligase